jgi:hypothetical protein
VNYQEKRATTRSFKSKADMRATHASQTIRAKRSLRRPAGLVGEGRAAAGACAVAETVAGDEGTGVAGEVVGSGRSVRSMETSGS